jgi:hypothetical protein
VLHADFNAIFEKGHIAEAACWAHVRRKFFDEHLKGSPVATEALERIAYSTASKKRPAAA